MPTIYVLGAIKIMIFFDDHAPPHFHAHYNGVDELIVINTLQSKEFKLPSKQRKVVLKWAKKNKALLMQRWNEFNPNN